MEAFNWQKTIRVNIIKLRAVGLWPKDDKAKLYKLWTAISFFCIIFAHNFFQVINIFLHLDDLKAVTSTIYINLSELLGILKAYYLFRNKAILRKLMMTLSSSTFQPQSQNQQNLVKASLKFWKIIYVLYWGMSGGAIFFWSTYPILDNSIQEHRLPFMAWYPFDTTISPYYEIAYAHQVIGIIFVATSTLGVDTLIAALNMYTGAQMDILQDNLRKISAESFRENLLTCIRHHKEIIKFATNSNNFYNWIVFFQFFISATSIGITMFQMTVVGIVVPFSSEFLSLLSFELAIIVEIFMYCWFGNEIKEKSNKISYALFESDWTGASLETKKILIFFMLKCEKPLTVSALNVFNLSLDTFMKILRASWSYFALLHQMGSKQ